MITIESQKSSGLSPKREADLAAVRWLGTTAVLGLFLAGFSAQAQEAGEPEGVETVIVQSTRSGRTVANEPVRVEVINSEEIGEKLMMRPGNISMMLSETGGLKVQVTSPALGSANIRVQGMRGRYTQLLTDGLPLSGGQASSIGLLQIPPTDLGQVEVIKGAASALYGPSALGGVINLISKRPAEVFESQVVGNATGRGGQDLTGYESAPLSGNWSQSLTGGIHHQDLIDLNHDSWADIPGYMRWTIRPRLFWNGENGATAFFTAGALEEKRRGGTLAGRDAPDGASFAQNQDTARYDAGMVAEWPLGGILTAHVRASGVTEADNRRFGAILEVDRHDTAFGEASLSGKSEKTSWVTGLAFQTNVFHSKTFANFNYAHEAPAVFVQLEHDLLDDLILAASARLDDHSQYGTRFSPRVSLLYKPGPWTFRASAGSGFYAPTPFIEEIEAAGLSRLEPLLNLKAETARTASIGGGYTSGAVEANITLFSSTISHAVQLETVNPNAPGGGDRVRLVNALADTRNQGVELLLRHRWDEYSLTANYVYVDATEPNPGGTARRTVPLTPHHSAGIVGMWEDDAFGRIALEAYYTGRQQLEDNPYRANAPDYVELGAMVQKKFEGFSLFLNLENLLDVRQTKFDPLLLPHRAPAGQWTVDAWGPTDGFTVNAGIRLNLGAADG